MARVAALAAFLLLAGSLLAAETASCAEPRRVSGYARGIDAGARDRAMAMAVREAVLEAIQERVPSMRITPYEPLLDRANDFVRDLRIVDYDTRDGISTLEAVVLLREEALRAAIATAWLEEALFKPRVVALAAARDGDDPYQVIPGNTAQAMLEKALIDAGLEVLGMNDIARFDDPPGLAAMAANAGESAPQLARAHLCEAAVFLLATVAAAPVPDSSNVYAVTASVTLIVASPRDGVPLQSEHSEALMHGSDPDEAAEAAIASATARLTRSALPLVILAAAAAEPRENDIIVTVEGRLDDDAIEALRGHYAGIQGVESVETLFHARGGVRLRITYPADPAGFIEPAMSDLPPTLSLEALRIVDREMHLRVRGQAE